MKAILRKQAGPGARERTDTLERPAAEWNGVMGTVPGLVSDTLARTDDGGFSVTVCQDQAGLDEGTQEAKEWIAQNAANTAAAATLLRLFRQTSPPEHGSTTKAGRLTGRRDDVASRAEDDRARCTDCPVLALYRLIRSSVLQHIITRKRLNEFAEQHPESRSALAHWYRLMKHATFHDFAELCATFPAADVVGKLTVFNVGGNKVRLIAALHFNRQRLYIRAVLTHAEDDTGTWKE